MFASAATEVEPTVLVERQPATLDEAVARAAEILANARAPLILGLEHLTCEAQSLAVALADRLGATIDSMSSLGVSSRGGAIQQVGESTCTLGDVRDRADLIVFWDSWGAICQLNASPSGTTMVEVHEAVDGSECHHGDDQAHRRFVVHKDVAFEAVCVLRALAKGISIDATLVLDQTCVPLDDWRWLADRMRQAQYGVIVGASRDMHVERALNELVVELNRTTRFANLNAALGGMNDVGAEQVLTWRSGYPFSVNFAAGYPRFGPREYSTEEVLKRGEADAVLAFRFPMFFDEAIEDGFLRLPRIVLASYVHEDEEAPTVFVRTTEPGLHSSGTIFRFDGVPLPLRALVTSPLPTTEQFLNSILSKISATLLR
jgi:formylmethanofuran dehydrogenase subunit B